jgi:tripartite-type tricarboxylate transporter receptor subunit TctC
MHLDKWICGIAAGLVLVCSGGTLAQSFPAKRVTVLIGFPAGSITDTEGRMMGKFLEQSWQEPVVVENRPGAGSLLAAQAMVKSPPDGYTLLYTASGYSTFRAFVKDLTFDPLKDAYPISMVANLPTGFYVNTQVPVKTIEDFVAYAKANPGKVNYASAAFSNALVTEQFKREAGIDLVAVPFSGQPDAMLSVLRNETQIMLGTMNKDLRSKINAGQLRALVVTGTQRARLFPEIPTASERGWNVPTNGWQAVIAPAGTPRPVIEKVAHDIAGYVSSPAAQSRAGETGIELTSNSPEQMRQIIENDTNVWSAVAAATGIKPQ